MADSVNRETSGTKTPFTIPSRVHKLEQPDSYICWFCKAELPFRPVMHPMYSEIVMAWLSPFDCTCPQSVESNKQHDRNRIPMDVDTYRAKKAQEFFESSGIPDRFISRTFDTFTDTPENSMSLAIAKDYASRFIEYRSKGTGLLITGSYGTGKTHLAAAISLFLLKNCIRVMHGTVTSILGQIRDTFNDKENGETESEVFERIIKIPLLVIDDMGKEKPTEWVEQTLYEIINSRYESNAPLIITTNLTLKEIDDRYKFSGGAMVSRIVEMCRGVKMNGPDWRKRKLEGKGDHK